jgi:hypothetical protein
VVTADDLTVDKDIDMRPHFALFGQNAIAQTAVRFPQLPERFRDGFGRHIQSDFGLATSEFSQVT